MGPENDEVMSALARNNFLGLALIMSLVSKITKVKTHINYKEILKPIKKMTKFETLPNPYNNSNALGRK